MGVLQDYPSFGYMRLGGSWIGAAGALGDVSRFGGVLAPCSDALVWGLPMRSWCVRYFNEFEPAKECLSPW